MKELSIVRLRIVLDHVEPKVLRCIEVPLSIRLDRLHMTLQAALGWTGSHLYEFCVGDIGWGIPDPYWEEVLLDARKATLRAILEETGAKSLGYFYDFGDGWEHTIKIERLIDAEQGVLYPHLVGAVGRCPPEDVRGPSGYQEFIEALADPKHERHIEMREWVGDKYDPYLLNTDALVKKIAVLARRWSRKPVTKVTHKG